MGSYALLYSDSKGGIIIKYFICKLLCESYRTFTEWLIHII